MDAVEDVKAKLSVEDVIGEYVELKRAGRNFKALSPWTQEKTASLMVSPDKQIWHDFSSGKGGNIFSFVMELEGLDFKGALELLARKAGVDLDKYKTGTSRGPSKERLYQVSGAAAHYFQTQFVKNKSALDYVSKKRQFTKETALAWRLGYSPEDGKALINYLKSRGFTDSEIKLAGLTNSYGSAMFRGRLMIPLADPQGRIIGFTARILSAGEPKYINTPATAIYDKSRHVFGLDKAKETIRQANYVVLAEGNLDVIASHQAGVANVVATAGTALTTQHLKTLARFTDDIRLSFDADKAGLAATERAIPLASRAGVSLSIITIPSGKDPDELIKQDKSKWLEIIDKPQYALDWLVEQYRARLDLASAKGKRQFSDVLLPVIKQLEDKVEQDHYINKLADILAVSYDSLASKMATSQTDYHPRRQRTEPAKLTSSEKSAAEASKVEEYLLAVLLKNPKLLGKANLIKPIMLSQKSREVWQKVNRADSEVDLAEQDLDDYVKILVLEFEELYQGLPVNELIYEVSRLQARLIENYVKTQKSKIARELAGADEARSAELLAGARKLDNLLKQAMGEEG